MEKISIVSFKLKECSDSQKTAIQRALKGYIDHSNKGSHTYQRKGILENIPHLILNKGVILIETKNKIKLTKILQENNSKFDNYDLFSNIKFLKIPPGRSH
jgi:hypothetical protein